MLRHLLESQAKPARRGGGAAISIGAHTAIIGLVIAATARATYPPNTAASAPRPVIYRADIAPSHIANHTSTTTWRGWLPPTVDVFVPPVKTAATLPSIDIDDRIARRGDFEGASVGVHELVDGTAVGVGSVIDSVFTATTVEKPAVPRGDNPTPIYPSSLRAALIEGTVVARFVVDTMGRAEPRSIVIVATTHPLFADAVRQTLLRSRYLPAMAGGRTVRQLVEQRFAFTIER